MTRSASGRAARRLRESVIRALSTLHPFTRIRVTRLLVAPHDLRTSDPTVATDIYAGYFVFNGRSVAAKGLSPFDVPPPSQAWAETLNGFVWLRHMRAANTAITRANARDLVDDFIVGKRDRSDVASRPAVMARRLISLLSHSPLLLEGTDHDFYNRFIQHCGRTVRELGFALQGPIHGLERLQAIIAIAFASLCLEGLGRLPTRAEYLLGDELDDQILPDGGHVSRNPRVLIELLLDLLPLRETYASRGNEAPRGLLTAIDRIMPHLRMFRHGDGTLGLFNGMGETEPDVLATLIAYDDARSRPMEHAPYSGYDRLEAGSTVVIADVGAPPPRAYSGLACAGCLAFEMSSGQHRIVVNCGTPRIALAELQMLARSTAAHSTVTVADTSSARFGRFTREHRVIRGPRSVELRREAGEHGVELTASHDGYRLPFGLVHERYWRLAPDGEMLDGEDRFTLDSATDRPVLEAALRFHLHPAIRASIIQDGAGALLIAPSGDAWVFEASGQPVMIEDSLFLANTHGSKRTAQLVVAVDAAAVRQVGWRFARLRPQGANAEP